jgi:hypothetical protein
MLAPGFAASASSMARSASARRSNDEVPELNGL